MLKTPSLARVYHSLRQDSGDPFNFALQAREFFHRMGKNITGGDGGQNDTKIVFSDAVTIDKAVALHEYCETIGLTCKFSDSLLRYVPTCIRCLRYRDTLDQRLSSDVSRRPNIPSVKHGHKVAANKRGSVCEIVGRLSQSS